MKFRFIQMHDRMIEADARRDIVSGIDYHGFKPTSVELTLSEIEYLLENPDRLQEVKDSLRDHDSRIMRIKVQESILKSMMRGMAFCKGCIFLDNGNYLNVNYKCTKGISLEVVLDYPMADCGMYEKYTEKTKEIE